MVSKARLDFPEPGRPVITTNRPRGISTLIFFRLCSRAPRTMILSCDMRAPVRYSLVYTGVLGRKCDCTLPIVDYITADIPRRKRISINGLTNGQADGNGRRLLPPTQSNGGENKSRGTDSQTDKRTKRRTPTPRPL